MAQETPAKVRHVSKVLDFFVFASHCCFKQQKFYTSLNHHYALQPATLFLKNNHSILLKF